VLNQQYTSIGAQLYCRLALGTSSMIRKVHPSFRCIMVVDREQALTGKISPALLNRCQKQLVSREDLVLPELLEGLSHACCVPVTSGLNGQEARDMPFRLPLSWVTGATLASALTVAAAAYRQGGLEQKHDADARSPQYYQHLCDAAFALLLWCMPPEILLAQPAFMRPHNAAHRYFFEQVHSNLLEYCGSPSFQSRLRSPPREVPQCTQLQVLTYAFPQALEAALSELAARYGHVSKGVEAPAPEESNSIRLGLHVLAPQRVAVLNCCGGSSLSFRDAVQAFFNDNLHSTLLLPVRAALIPLSHLAHVKYIIRTMQEEWQQQQQHKTFEERVNKTIILIIHLQRTDAVSYRLTLEQSWPTVFLDEVLPPTASLDPCEGLTLADCTQSSLKQLVEQNKIELGQVIQSVWSPALEAVQYAPPLADLQSKIIQVSRVMSARDTAPEVFAVLCEAVQQLLLAPNAGASAAARAIQANMPIAQVVLDQLDSAAGEAGVPAAAAVPAGSMLAAGANRALPLPALPSLPPQQRNNLPKPRPINSKLQHLPAGSLRPTLRSMLAIISASCSHECCVYWINTTISTSH